MVFCAPRETSVNVDFEVVEVVEVVIVSVGLVEWLEVVLVSEAVLWEELVIVGPEVMVMVG